MADWFLVYPELRTIKTEPTKRHCVYHVDEKAKIRRESKGIYRVENNRYNAYIICGYPTLHKKLAENKLTTKDFEIDYWNVQNPNKSEE